MIKQKKYKLLWMIDSLRQGGAERLTVPILKTIDPNIFEIRVCSLQKRNNNPIEKDLTRIGIPVDELNIQRLRDPSNVPGLIRYLKTHQPDLVHTQLQFADTLGTVASRLLKIPSVSTQHRIDFTSKSKGGRRQKLTWWVLRNFSERVIAVSEITRQYHVRLGQINDNRIVTMYNGIQIERFSNVAEFAVNRVKDELGIPIGSRVITTVAVLREPKGIQYMINAMQTLQKTFPDLVYLVVGDGHHKAALEEQAANKELTGKVIFSGRRSDIPEILAASDIFVLPTLVDALPTVLFEAQAAGLPIIASQVGGVPEIITDKFDGLLVPPADPGALHQAVENLIRDDSLREKLAKTGYETVQSRFSVESQVAQLTRLYLDILGDKKL